MKSVTLHSNDQQKLDLLVQLAKEIGVDVVVHYSDSSDTNTDTANEPDERYTTKVLVYTSEEKRGKKGDYHLPGPPPSTEDLEAWLDDSDDGDEEYSIDEVMDYVRKEIEKDKKK